MARTFFHGFFATVLFIAVVAAVLGAIFLFTSYLSSF
jgi:hypothetical protein